VVSISGIAIELYAGCYPLLQAELTYSTYQQRS